MSQIQVTGEAKIRDIQGPVVANSGVITALDGAASQYVRGDGTLADFPTSTGGGSSVSYYLNSSVSQGTIGGVAYRELSKEPIIGTGTDIAISSNGYVANYLTDANDPDVVLVPGGNFNCEFYFSVSNDTGNPFTYAELYKYDGTNFTLLGTSAGVPESINQGTVINPYYFAIPVATATLALTDRLAIRIYVNVDGRTVTLHTENGHLCQVVTTFSKGMVSLNNLTDQSQYLTTGTSGTNFAIASSGDTHTFNLPIASATNTGKLSSTDWSTFNNKQNALTNPITGLGNSGNVAYFDGVSSITSENSFNYDASTNRLGVNTTVPNATIGANASTDSGYSLLVKNDNANYNGIGFATTSTYGNVIGTEKLGTAPAMNLTLLNQSGYISLTEVGNLGVNILNPNTGLDIYNGTSSYLWLHTANSGITGTDGVRLALFSNNTANLRNFEGAMSITSEGDFSVITLGAENLRVNSADGSIYQSKVANAMLKSVSGVITAAVAGTDYVDPSGLSAYVPYTGATTNVNLGTHSLSAYDLIINHTSGSGVAASITKGGNGEALTVVKSSGSGNAASITGGVTLLSELHLTTSLADAYIASAATWNAKMSGSGTSGQVAYFNGPNSVTSEAGFIYDSSTNRLGVNTSVPNATIGADAALDSGYGLLIKTGASNYNGIGIAIDSTYGNTIEAARLGTAPSRNLTLLNVSGYVSLTETGNFGVGILTPNNGIDIYNSTQSQLWLHNAATGITATDGVRLALFNSKEANLRNFDGGLSLTAEGDFSIITIGAENFRINSANGFVGIGNPASLPSMLTVNGGATITGLTTGQVLFPTSGGTLSGSSSLFWDNTNAKLGLGTTTLSGARLTITSVNEAEHLHLVANAPALTFTNALSLTYYAGIGMATASNNFVTGAVQGDLALGAFNTSSILFYNNNTNTMRMSLNGSGAAIFSGSVTARGPKSQIIVDGNSVGAGLLLSNSIVGVNRRNWGIFTEQDAEGDFVIKRSTVSGGDAQSGTTILSLLNTGAATFSSTLQVNSYQIINGASAGFTFLQFNNNGTPIGYTGSAAAIVTGGSASDYALATAQNIVFGTGGSFTEKMRITSGGNVGIGTTPATWSAGTTLEIGSVGNLALHNSSAIGNLIAFNTYYNGAWYYKGTNVALGYVQDSEGHKFYYNGSGSANTTFSPNERMRITNGGELLIGTTSQFLSGLQCISGNSNTYNLLALRDTLSSIGSDNWYAFFVNNSNVRAGGIQHTTSTTVSFITTSDYRLKENAQLIQNGLTKILGLKPVTYTWKEDGSLGEGFIAHELQEYIPMAVCGTKDAIDKNGKINPQGVDYSKIVPYLVKAIQEQTQIIKDLEARIKQLENK